MRPLATPLIPFPPSDPCRLWLAFASLDQPLPDIQPGALPCLVNLRLVVERALTTLPASWGTGPDVLPALRMLTIDLPSEGHLPAAWAGGFRKLATLVIDCKRSKQQQPQPGKHTPEDPAAPVAAAAAPAAPPPPPWHGPMYMSVSALQEWLTADGATPLAPLPPEWASPLSFPSLTMLSIRQCGLAGTIPAAWLQGGFPSLTVL